MLDKLPDPPFTPARQRVLEAIDLLGQMQTPEATALLQEIKRDTWVPQIRSAACNALQCGGG